MNRCEIVLGGVACAVFSAAANVAADGSGSVDADAICRVEVKVSSFGFDPNDSTRFIQAALDSGAKRVILDRQSSPWIATSIYGRSNQEFIFEEGAEILARRGAFKGLRDKLLNYVQCSNVVVRGLGEKGGTLRMWKKDYQDKSQYKPAEWRYTLDIRGCSNVLVENMNCIASGGDGICIACLRKDGRTIVPKDITLRKCVMDDNHRQGLTIGCGENVLIEDCVMKNTCGTPPQAGVDLEPDKNDERLVNVVFRRCRAENNRGSGFELYAAQLDNTCPPVSIRFEDCSTRGNAQEVSMLCGKRERSFVKGNVQFSNCAFGPSRKADAPGVGVETSKRGFNVTFDSCKGAEKVRETHPIGDVVFDLLGDREPGPRTLPAVDRVKVVDVKPGVPAGVEPIEYVGGASLLCFARAGEVARFRAHQYTVVAGRPASAKPILICPVNEQGKAVGKPLRVKLPGFEGGTFEFRAPTTAFYSIAIDCAGVRFVLEEANVPVALNLTKGSAKISGFLKKALPFTLHAVTFDRRDTCFAVQGDWYYKFACTVRDPDGKVVWNRPLVEAPEAGMIPYRDGVWSVTFARGPKPHYDWIVFDVPDSQMLLFVSSEKLCLP